MTLHADDHRQPDDARLREKSTTDQLVREGEALVRATEEVNLRIKRISELYQERLANMRAKP
jgi:hypothetical protein